jgi:DNA polymerase-3 subunit epsilon
MAHNGLGFDKPILASNFARLGVLLPDRTWIDTMLDLPLARFKSRALGHLAADHGFLNPFAHRALFDVLTMLRVASSYDIKDVLASARSPVVTVQALCAKPWEDGGASTDEAKRNGFRWDGGNKRWVKQLRQAALESQPVAAAYKTVIIG